MNIAWWFGLNVAFVLTWQNSFSVSRKCDWSSVGIRDGFKDGIILGLKLGTLIGILLGLAVSEYNGENEGWADCM